MGALPQFAAFSVAGTHFGVVHGGATETSQFIWPGDDKSAEIATLEAALGPIDVVIAGHCGLGFIEDDWINAGVIGMPPNEG